MKKFSVFILIFSVVILSAQKISDYKYVVIPQEFTDFKANKSYHLGTLLERALKLKKYQILSDQKSGWPSEALANPCQVLTADLQDDKSMFRNKVILDFKDCNNAVVLTQKGGSTIKEFEAGYQDALKQAIVALPVSNPGANPATIAQQKPQDSRPVENAMPQEPLKETSTPVKNMAQRFSNGKMVLQKIQLDSSQFILADGNSSVPFATFKTTAKADVYRVKLASGESTIGYFENGNLVIEMPKSNGEFVNEIFTAN